jgi:flagellar basal body rod protein FlgF
MASAYQIFGAMQAATNAAQLAAALRAHADDMVAIEARGYRTDFDQLRNAAIIHAERVTGVPFFKIIADAIDGKE